MAALADTVVVTPRRRKKAPDHLVPVGSSLPAGLIPEPEGQAQGAEDLVPVTFAEIAVRDLFLDPRFNRLIDREWVRTLAKRWVGRKLGVLNVSKRPDGRYVVLSGQHRAAALVLKGWLDTPVPCNVYEGLSEQEEAERVFAFNAEVRRWQSVGLFRNQLFSGEQEANEIVQTVEEVGLQVATDHLGERPGKIRAVNALRGIYRQVGMAGLKRVLTFLKDAYGDDPAAYQTAVMKGVHLFLVRYHGIFREAQFRERLGQTPLTDLLRNARGYATMGGSNSLSRGVGIALVEDVYNYHRSAHRLPNWWRMTAAQEQVVLAAQRKDEPLPLTGD